MIFEGCAQNAGLGDATLMALSALAIGSGRRPLQALPVQAGARPCTASSSTAASRRCAATSWLDEIRRVLDELADRARST
jgi:hypothetical protein